MTNQWYSEVERYNFGGSGGGSSGEVACSSAQLSPYFSFTFSIIALRLNPGEKNTLSREHLILLNEKELISLCQYYFITFSSFTVWRMMFDFHPATIAGRVS